MLATHRVTLVAIMVAALLVLGASLAFACIPWAGKVELDNVGSSGEENGTTVHGADISDVDRTDVGSGNDQGMVWCKPSSQSDNSQAVGQEYPAAEVHPSGDSADDIELTVTGKSGCDIRLPEDTYDVTWSPNGTFVNENDSHVSTDSDASDPDSDGVDEPTYSDFQPQGSTDDPDHGGKDEFKHGSNAECMHTDGSTNPDDHHLGKWNLVEDDNGLTGDDTQDDSQGQIYFPEDDRDVIDQGPHSKEFDLDQVNNGDGPEVSGDNEDGHELAGAVCITSEEKFEHDNTEGDGDDKDDIMKEYGNAVPVRILDSV